MNKGKFLIAAGLLLCSAAVLVIPVFGGIGSGKLGGILAFLALVSVLLPGR